VVEEEEFRNTRNGTEAITKTMSDFSTVKSYLEKNNLAHFTSYPKSPKPIKAVIRYLLLNTPEEDISDGLMSLAFDVISFKQMAAPVGHLRRDQQP
jgi:hypothetical protein